MAPSAWKIESRAEQGTAHAALGSETEPTNLPAETDTGRVVFQARKPQSPVRIREASTAKAPRNRGDFRAAPECVQKVSTPAD